MFEFLINLIFPPKCPICNEHIWKNGELCENCLKKTLNVRESPKYSPLIEEFVVIANYKNGARGLIRDLKFKNKTSRVKNIDYILQQADKFIPKYPKEITAVFVPISKKRMAERGFNQVELMFKEWLKRRKIVYKDILIRAKATEHQYALSPAERIANVKDAFKATEKLDGEDILLLDDILTTGATALECAKTLKAAGAGRIYALMFSGDD